jgi:spore cortex formation protein SpoVR/YcgB (stage V sporulation)
MWPIFFRHLYRRMEIVVCQSVSYDVVTQQKQLEYISVVADEVDYTSIRRNLHQSTDQNHRQIIKVYE